MRKFAYKAINSTGEAIEGELEAPSEKDLETHFIRQRLIPVRVEERKDEPDETFLTKVRARMKRKLFESELIAFTRQFAAAYGAGIAVGRTLDLLARTTEHPIFKKTIEKISEKVQGGMGLTEAFEQHPLFFDPTYTAILKSGEVSGNLDAVLNYSANLLEKKLLHKERLKSTLLYPKLVVGMIAITMTVVVVFVIPQFAKLYEKFDAPLPLPTRMMLAFSDILVGYWWSAVVVVPAIAYFIKWLKNNPEFMLWFHEKMVNMPILGSTFLKIELTHFATTFALLLRSGIKITAATQIAINSMKNTYMRAQLATIIGHVEQGGTLADALSTIPVIPPLMASMVSIGEETGTLEGLLDRVAALYEHETELQLKKLPTLLEPLVLGCLFVMVFLLALAVYLPMWKMASLLRR